MPTRRTTLLGLGQLFLGAGALSSGAFGAAANVSSDLRVLVASDLALTAGRDDGRYVETDDHGQVTAINLTDNPSNQHARTRFEDLVILTNHGDLNVHGLEFELEVVDNGLQGDDPSAGDIEDVFQIVSAEGAIDAVGEENFFEISDADAIKNGELAPGESIPFGLQIDLQPESGPGSIGSLPESERFDVVLTIRAKRE